MALIHLLFFLSTTFAQNPTFEALYKTGVQNYQEKKFEEARDAFTKSVALDPTNTSALTNLALTEFQLGHKGLAVALLRKASALDPDFSTPRAALKFVLPQLDVKEIPHEIQLWETLRSQFLSPVPQSAYLLLTALLLFSSGWIFLGYFGKRKFAIKKQLPFPPFPFVGLLFALGFIFCLSLALLKSYDYQIPRGTIVADKVSVLAAPEEKSAPLFDLYSGLEVIINSANGDWLQVTYPGAMTGWIPKASVLHTTGKLTW